MELTSRPTSIEFLNVPSTTARNSVHIRKWKLEAGDAATPWQMADEDESEATRYLREALKEATAGTTEIAGGLVLSNMMGVKKDGAIVAGINGTNDGHNLPMIWAGASDGKTPSDAPFRVYNSGSVIMNDVSIGSVSNGNAGLTISGGVIRIGNVDESGEIRDVNVKTKITPEEYDSVETLANSVIGAPSNATIPSAKSVTTTASKTDERDISLNSTHGDVVTTYIVPPNGDNGSVKFYAADSTLTISGSCSQMGRPLDGTPYMTVTARLVLENVTQNTREVVAEAIGSADWTSASASLNLSTDHDTQIDVSPGDTVKLMLYAICNSNRNFSGSTITPGQTPVTPSYTSSQTATATFTPKQATIGQGTRVFNNHYFADGFVLSSSTEKYFAVASKAGGDKGEIMRMRSGLAITRQTNEGLWQSLDGATYFRASPLVFVLHYKWTGSQWNYDAANSWAASSQYGQELAPSYSTSTKMLKVSYKGLSIPHVQAQYICQYAWYHLQVYSQTKTEMQLRIINHNGTVVTPYDTNDELYIYGYCFT